MIVSRGFLPSEYAGAMMEPKVLFPCRGGVMIASFAISPASNRSRYSITIRWTGATSNAGIIMRAKEASERRAIANRRILGVSFVVVMFMGEHSLTATQENWG